MIKDTSLQGMRPTQPATPLVIFRGKGAVAAVQTAVEIGEEHYFAEDVAWTDPSHSQDTEHKVIRAGLNQTKSVMASLHLDNNSST